VSPLIWGADHDDNDVLSAFRIRIPSREQLGIAGSTTAAYLVGVRQHLYDPIPMSRQKIRVSFGNVGFTLGGELNIAVKVRATE
jgi:hypothetical protein